MDDNRNWRAGVYVGIVVSLVSSLASLGIVVWNCLLEPDVNRNRTTGNEVVCNRLVVTDASGVERITLGVDHHQSAYLGFSSGNGDDVLSLRLSQDGNSNLVMMNKGGNFSVTVGQGGSVAVKMMAAEGRARAILNFRPDRFLDFSVFDIDNTRRMRFGVPFAAETSAMLADQEGKQQWSVP